MLSVDLLLIHLEPIWSFDTYTDVWWFKSLIYWPIFFFFSQENWKINTIPSYLLLILTKILLLFCWICLVGVFVAVQATEKLQSSLWWTNWNITAHNVVERTFSLFFKRFILLSKFSLLGHYKYWYQHTGKSVFQTSFVICHIFGYLFGPASVSVYVTACCPGVTGTSTSATEERPAV